MEKLISIEIYITAKYKPVSLSAIIPVSLTAAFWTWNSLAYSCHPGWGLWGQNCAGAMWYSPVPTVIFHLFIIILSLTVWILFLWEERIVKGKQTMLTLL